MGFWRCESSSYVGSRPSTVMRLFGGSFDRNQYDQKSALVAVNWFSDEDDEQCQKRCLESQTLHQASSRESCWIVGTTVLLWSLHASGSHSVQNVGSQLYLQQIGSTFSISDNCFTKENMGTRNKLVGLLNNIFCPFLVQFTAKRGFLNPRANAMSFSWTNSRKWCFDKPAVHVQLLKCQINSLLPWSH